MSKLGNVPHRYARYAEIMFYEDASGWQTFKYGKLGELTENIRTFALPFENQTYTFKMNFEYDPFNRIQSILYPDSERVEYQYNLGGMLNKVTGSVTRKITDLIVVTPMQNTSLLQGGNEIQGGGIAPGIIPDPGPIEIQTVTLRYPYLDSIVYNKFELKDSVIYGNGTRVRYVYDSLQRLSALRSYTADDELMQDIAYHYDSVGNILNIENSAAALGNGLGGTYRQEYTYDNLYRLTHATGWWECRPDHLTLRDTVDMRYSKNGRIIRKRMSAETLKNMQLNLVRYDRQYQYPSVYSNKVNRVTDAISGTSHQFEWESGGNLMRHENPDQHYDRRLCWTEDNRLQFVKDNGSTGAYYQYDAGGDRTYKLLYHKTTGSLNGVQTDYYTLDDATLYVSPYLVVTPQGYTKHYYAESERITTQLGKYRFAVVDSCVAGDSLASVKLQNAVQAFPTDSFPTPAPMLGYLHSLVSKPKAVSTLYFYHPDHLGSASWITNIYGRTIQHLYYLPWGEDFVNQRTGSFSSMYTFSAKEKDTETGYSYFGARYYSSDLSIWLNVDPMSDKYPSLSPYVYCADNPVKLVDPNGMEYGKKPVSRKRAKATVSEIKKSAIEANREINHNSTWNIQGEYRYTGQGKKTDTRSTSAKEFNMYVNYDLVFYVDESNANSYENYELYVVTCMLVHFVSGTGPENYDFPENGRISKAMAKSSVVKQAIKAYKKDGKTEPKQYSFGFWELFRNTLVNDANIYNIEGMVGSAMVTITPTNDGMLSITIFNIMSLTSGDYFKDIGIGTNWYPQSIMRDPNQRTPYGNISQTFHLLVNPDDY